jgi:hypothetical protein
MGICGEYSCAAEDTIRDFGEDNGYYESELRVHF